MKIITVLATLLLCVYSAAHAQTVGLTGMLGTKALVMVDGGPPKGVAVGDTYRGVKIVSTQGDQAVVEIGGKRHTLRVGDAPASVGSVGSTSAEGEPGGTRVVLTAGSGGHFFSLGQINGQTVQFLVDTGATSVAMGVADAERIGLNYRSAPMGQSSTANGIINTWRVKLASVKLGDVVVYNVDASVLPGAMPHVLLGNSFLTRFQMTRTNDQMVLEKRY
jgi:aspartyl protease family protein